MNYLRCLIGIFFVALYSMTYSQEVGLVLSGGAAKGLAHVGVLKALEENNIPIDFITGTSMGAIIGGLYVIGYSPWEIEEFVLSEDFKNWSKGHIEEEYVYYFKKKDDNSAQFSIKLITRDSIIKTKLPTNIIPMHQIDFGFMQIFAGPTAACNSNFDQLMVPFRCVASDVYNNASVELSKGDLGSAIRASMTYPFYFKPIKIDGKLLFDGGIYNNFPRDVMINDFSPDIVIGSKTAKNTIEPGEDDILLQLENMITTNTDYNLSKKKGILIETNFTSIETLDFAKGVNIIEKGYNSTIANMEEIKNRIKRRVSKEEISNKRKTFKEKVPELYFNNVFIQGLRHDQKEYVKRSIWSKDTVINMKKLKEKYFELIAENSVSSSNPIAKYNSDKVYFDLYLKLKDESSIQFMVGGNISSSSLNQGFGGIEYTHLGRLSKSLDFNLYYGRLYSSAQIKGRFDYPAKLPFYFDMGITFNRWDYFKSSNSLFFSDFKPSYLIQNEYNLRSEFGLPVYYNAVIKGGFAIGRISDEYYQTKLFLESDTVDITNFDLTTFHLTFEKKTLNYKQYAFRGRLQQIQFRYVYGEEEHIPGSTSLDDVEYKGRKKWFTVRILNDSYHRMARNFWLGIYMEGLYSTQSFFNKYTPTVLNAPTFRPTPHSKTLFIEKYRAHKYLAFGIKPIIRISEKVHFRNEIYVFQPYKEIKRDSNLDSYYGKSFSNRQYHVMSAFVYQSLIGPVSLSMNYYHNEQKKFYFLFNFGYILFNRKALD